MSTNQVRIPIDSHHLAVRMRPLSSFSLVRSLSPKPIPTLFTRKKKEAKTSTLRRQIRYGLAPGLVLAGGPRRADTVGATPPFAWVVSLSVAASAAECVNLHLIPILQTPFKREWKCRGRNNLGGVSLNLIEQHLPPTQAPIRWRATRIYHGRHHDVVERIVFKHD